MYPSTSAAYLCILVTVDNMITPLYLRMQPSASLPALHATLPSFMRSNSGPNLGATWIRNSKCQLDQSVPSELALPLTKARRPTRPLCCVFLDADIESAASPWSRHPCYPYLLLKRVWSTSVKPHATCKVATFVFLD